jgi:hypothetical protein
MGKNRFFTGIPNFTKKALPSQIRASYEEFSADMVSDLPRILVKIGSMSVIAMIDTGSDVTFRSERITRELQQQIKPIYITAKTFDEV